jgi:hypothetical protein
MSFALAFFPDPFFMEFPLLLRACSFTAFSSPPLQERERRGREREREREERDMHHNSQGTFKKPLSFVGFFWRPMSDDPFWGRGHMSTQQRMSSFRSSAFPPHVPARTCITANTYKFRPEKPTNSHTESISSACKTAEVLSGHGWRPGCVEALGEERALLLAFWTVHRPPSRTAAALALRLLHALAATPAAAWSAAAQGGALFLLAALMPPGFASTGVQACHLLQIAQASNTPLGCGTVATSLGWHIVLPDWHASDMTGALLELKSIYPSPCGI